MRCWTFFLLLACCWAASTQLASAAASRARAGPTGAAPALQALLRLMKQHETLDNGQSALLVKLAKDVVRALSGENSSQQPPARLAAGTLETLLRAGPRAATPVHRAQLLVERGKLLQLMGRAEAAEEQMEQAAALLTAELASWRVADQQGGGAAAAGQAAGQTTGGAAADAAGEAGQAEAASAALGAAGTARGKAAASAALSTLLDVASTLRQLGREARANELLTGAVAAAPMLGSANSYLRGLAQLSKLTDEQLEGVLSCILAVEGASDPAADGCSWMRLNGDGTQGPAHKPLPDKHRLYYAAHRGLHARRRYTEAWAALDKAKRLHFLPHTGNYTEKGYSGGLAEVRRLFPPAGEGSGNLAQAAATAANFAEDAQVNGSDAAAAAAEAGMPPAEPTKAAQPAEAQAAVTLQSAAGSSAAWLQRQLRKLTRARGPAAQGTDSQGDSGAAAGGGGRELQAIFVTGLPRSGSTLIEQILASHPEVFGAGEHTPMRPVASRLQELLEAGNGSVAAAALTQLRRRYLSGMRAKVPPERQASTRWIVDKSLANTWVLGHIAALLPDACLVHAVRHPADAALSAFQQSFFPHKVPWSFNLSTIAANVAAHHELMALWDAAFPGRVLHLHYAHMVADQEGSSRRLAQHCGLPWHDAMLRFYETDRTVQTASQLQVKKPIYTSSLDKWHAYKDGLAPLLLQLRETILRYEEQAGLPSSKQLLDELAAKAAEQQQATGQQPPAQGAADLAGVQAAAAEQQAATEDQETTPEGGGTTMLLAEANEADDAAPLAAAKHSSRDEL
ncbi:hypothetical protein ABPG77_002628 [Micractinium sp. CCAP 211/92]